jgi:hypothetical protein
MQQRMIRFANGILLTLVNTAAVARYGGVIWRASSESTWDRVVTFTGFALWVAALSTALLILIRCDLEQTMRELRVELSKVDPNMSGRHGRGSNV